MAKGFSVSSSFCLFCLGIWRKERQRGRRGATQLNGVSGLHIDASLLPFPSLLLHFLLSLNLWTQEV